MTTTETKIYSITIESVQEYEAFIEATSPEEARAIAEEIMTHDSIACVVAFGNPADERIKPYTPIVAVDLEVMENDELQCFEENKEKLAEARGDLLNN